MNVTISAAAIDGATDYGDRGPLALLSGDVKVTIVDDQPELVSGGAGSMRRPSRSGYTSGAQSNPRY